MVWDFSLINQWNELLRFRVSKILNVFIFFPSEAPEIECLWIFHNEADIITMLLFFFFFFSFGIKQFSDLFFSSKPFFVHWERGKKIHPPHIVQTVNMSKRRRSFLLHPLAYCLEIISPEIACIFPPMQQSRDLQ